MSFGTDEYRALQKGHFDEKRAIECMFTDLGASFYAYMVMLDVANRKIESKSIDDLRKKIFGLRDKFYDKEYGNNEHREYSEICIEMRTIERYLQIYKPSEAIIFQSPVNQCIGLGYILKEYLKLE